MNFPLNLLNSYAKFFKTSCTAVTGPWPSSWKTEYGIPLKKVVYAGDKMWRYERKLKLNNTRFVLYNQDLKNPQTVLALLVDFSKAFHRQNHNIVIEILSDLDVPYWLLCLVSSFLSKRELILRYKGKTSKKNPLPSKKISLPEGTPPGMRLGNGYVFIFDTY